MRKATISGRGPFPFDMLRYDEAFPASTVDAQKLGNIPDHEHFSAEVKVWTIQIATHKRYFTTDRWNSFGVGIRIDD
jgi:hypothetical protein